MYPSAFIRRTLYPTKQSKNLLYLGNDFVSIWFRKDGVYVTKERKGSLSKLPF